MAKGVKRNVLWILEHYPETRNSDKKLIITFWKNFNPEFIATNEDGDWVQLHNVIVMANPESIRRSRQIIQNKEGRFPPTDPVVLERRSKEKKIRQTINDSDFDEHLPD